MAEPRQNFAMDAIQEFKVSTSTYKAEYGLATGGQLTVVTKSNAQRHGMVLWDEIAAPLPAAPSQAD